MRTWFLIAMSITTLGEEVLAQVGGVPPDGPYSTTIPGAVGGFDLLLKKYGTRDYRPLLADAIEVASHGDAVSAWGAGNFRRSHDMLARWDSSAKVFLPGGKDPGIGHWLVQPDLARSISMIAEQGAGAFYRGDIARRLRATTSASEVLSGLPTSNSSRLKKHSR